MSISIPHEIEQHIIGLTIGGVIEREVRLIRNILVEYPSDQKYFMTRAGIHLCSQARVIEPIYHFRLNDSDPLLPVFNEYVRQLSPLLARN
jgi:hypothetical protein